MSAKELIKSMPFVRRYLHARFLYPLYKKQDHETGKYQFYFRSIPKIHVIKPCESKTEQVCRLIRHVNVTPVENRSFFYSVDPYSSMSAGRPLLDNIAIDYSWVISGSFAELGKINGRYDEITKALKEYVDRAASGNTDEHLAACLNEIKNIFIKGSESFHEGLQRVLFINQWLWQTGHKHNGFGHLDLLLGDLYLKDISSGAITEETAKEYIKDFFRALHANCWFKSNLLLGDTGQIITLGGLSEDGSYRYNELTTVFIDAAKEAKLPEPKLILRSSASMPDHLLAKAVECISTGIGSPLLCNDDRIINSLIQFGYDSTDAYGYSTSACWEPLIVGNACEHNNQWAMNYCKPLIELFNSDEFESLSGFDEVVSKYYQHLTDYVNKELAVLDAKTFEPDPLLTLFDPKVLATGKDITEGGAKYVNSGITSIGLSTVVDSLLVIRDLVFGQKKYTLHELNEKRRNNFENEKELLDEIKKNISFGNDDPDVLELTNSIMRKTSGILDTHKNRSGGAYKFGLSSPEYIVGSADTEATFDGRKNSDPFGVNISGRHGLAPTELICFASGLDYEGNRINGNVVDLILSPSMMKNNANKMIAFLKGAIAQGIYQIQINVVDSKTLIEAQKHPESFPDLVVRVWGFSAYFIDLPKEYQDVLINRTIEAEMQN